MESNADDLIARVNTMIQRRAEFWLEQGRPRLTESPIVIVAVDEMAEVHAQSAASTGVALTSKDLVERIIREMCARPSCCRRSERP